jgi:hypothetical protein
MMWTVKFEIDDPTRVVVPSEHREPREPSGSRSLPKHSRGLALLSPPCPASRAGSIGRRHLQLLASRLQHPEKGCQSLPGVFPCNSLKISGRCPKRVTTKRGGSRFQFSNFQFQISPLSERVYSTMLASRIGCNTLKTKHRRVGYPTINPGGLEPSLTSSCAPPRMKRRLRQGTASAVPNSAIASGVLTPEAHHSRQCLKP